VSVLLNLLVAIHLLSGNEQSNYSEELCSTVFVLMKLFVSFVLFVVLIETIDFLQKSSDVFRFSGRQFFGAFPERFSLGGFFEKIKRFFARTVCSNAHALGVCVCVRELIS
jgi:hypothetical protein